jgi:hypothetical protein
MSTKIEKGAGITRCGMSEMQRFDSACRSGASTLSGSSVPFAESDLRPD